MVIMFCFELIVVIVVVKFYKQIKEEFILLIYEVIFWMDFIIVLQYINNSYMRFQIFVVNWFVIIYDFLNLFEWCYVSFDFNLVDIVLCGL